MRILMLAHQWIPQHNAGAEVMAHAMLRALVLRGHEVDVTLSRQTGEPYVLDGVRLWPGSDPRCRVSNADVIVTHLEQTAVAGMLGRWHDVPVVQILHNALPVTVEHTHLAQLVVANSEWMLADVTAAKGGALPPAIICRPPVDPATYRTIPGDRITLINLRRMETSPGGMTMGKGSEVFWTLAERLPHLSFLAVRGAYGDQDVRELSNVEVLEHVPHDRMRDEVYARTRILLMPSSYESWGRTAVEAMASGIPTIAHPTPGLTEALGSSGWLADRDDIVAWVSALDIVERAYPYMSELALKRSAQLDPTDDLTRWCSAVEALRR